MKRLLVVLTLVFAPTVAFAAPFPVINVKSCAQLSGGSFACQTLQGRTVICGGFDPTKMQATDCDL